MKKVILVPAMVIALMASYSGSAQNNGAVGAKPQGDQPGPQRPADPHQLSMEQTEKATKRYTLTPEQKNRWHAAAMQRNMERMSLKMQLQGETTPEQRKEMRAQAKQQNDQFDKNVKEFLTPDQYAKFTKDKQEREKKRKEAAKKKKANDKEVHELHEE